MSVIIRANQLNTLIYKYFLEANLSHSAYTLFNEAALAQPLQQLRFDVHPGHLLSLLEKALLYNKIEQHVSLHDYVDCDEPFHLLTPHTCKLSEKVKKERDETLKGLEQSINDGIRRTNSIYSQAIANRDFEEIVYEAKSGKYLQKFAKLRLPAGEGEGETAKFSLTGSDSRILLYNPDQFELDLLAYDLATQEMRLQRIFPSASEGQLVKSLHQTVTQQHLIQLFSNNRVTFYNLAADEASPIQFVLPAGPELKEIAVNPTLEQLVCFRNEVAFCVVNLANGRVLEEGEGRFEWRSFEEYLVVKGDNIFLKALGKDEPRMSFESSIFWEEIQFNQSRSLFIAISYTNSVIHLHTFHNPQPLFVFNLEDKGLKQALFATSNNVDYLVWLGNEAVAVFDLSLNAYSRVIETGQWVSEVKKLSLVRKSSRDQCYLLCLGLENLLVYDLTLSKIQRIEIEGESADLFPLGSARVALTTEASIYFLTGHYIEPIFR